MDLSLAYLSKSQLAKEVSSKLRATMKDAPNSPRDIANVKTVATNINPSSKVI